MSTVNWCGSGAAGVVLHAECQIVEVLPSSTLAATPFSCAVSWLSVATVHRVRGSAGSVPPRRLTSAAADHSPRLPASVTAVSRTNRVRTVAKVAVLSTASSANVPVATGWLHVVPLVLVVIWYCPIRPSGESDGGR
jgi:hypothetical protein